MACTTHVLPSPNRSPFQVVSCHRFWRRSPLAERLLGWSGRSSKSHAAVHAFAQPASCSAPHCLGRSDTRRRVRAWPAGARRPPRIVAALNGSRSCGAGEAVMLRMMPQGRSWRRSNRRPDRGLRGGARHSQTEAPPQTGAKTDVKQSSNPLLDLRAVPVPLPCSGRS